MTLTFGSRRSSGKNAAAFALGGNAAEIDSTGGAPVLAITVKSSFASAVRVGATSCARSSCARVPWITSTTEPALSTSFCVVFRDNSYHRRPHPTYQDGTLPDGYHQLHLGTFPVI